MVFTVLLADSLSGVWAEEVAEVEEAPLADPLELTESQSTVSAAMNASALTVTIGSAYAAGECDAKPTGNVALSMDTVDGGMYYACLNVYVDTQSESGYSVGLSASTATLNSTQGNSIFANSGSMIIPKTLDNNAWGFCIPGEIAATPNGFDTGLTTACGGHDTASNTSAPATLKYAAVPTTRTPVRNLTVAPQTDSDRNTPIRFAVRPAISTPRGLYSTTITIAVASEEFAPANMHIQNITTANGPVLTGSGGEGAAMVVDARDNKTYWVGKLSNGQCWMLTNLAYTGNSEEEINSITRNIYGDMTPAIQNGTNDTGLGRPCNSSYTTACYYTTMFANPTSNPTEPSKDTDGGVTGTTPNPETAQFGYLYNWCAALNSQATACQGSSSSQPDQTANVGGAFTSTDAIALPNICPKGWRLPTGGTGGEYQAMTTAISATNNAAGSTNLRGNWLAQYGGNWSGSSIQLLGSRGYFWSSTVTGSSSAYSLSFTSSTVSPASYGNKNLGLSVRCVAGL